MFTEDLTVFLSDFGVSVTAGAGLPSGLGILDMPSEVILSDMVISTDYQVRCETSKLGWLGYEQPLEVDGGLYSVREVRRVDDGRFCVVTLQPLQQSTAEVVIDGDGIFDNPQRLAAAHVLNGDWK